MKQKFDIELDSMATPAEIERFYNFLREDHIPNITFAPKTVSPAKGEMGTDWLPIITAIISAPVLNTVITKLLDVLHSYLSGQKKKDTVQKIIIRNEEGKTITITKQDLSKDSIEEISQLLELASFQNFSPGKNSRAERRIK